MQSRLAPLESARWSETLAGIEHDFFHQSEYVRLSAEHERGEAMVFIAREGRSCFLVPLIVREIGGFPSDSGEHLCDATSPYSYSSPLFENADDDFAHRAVQEFLVALRERKIVTCFLRLHPLMPIPLHVLERVGPVVLHGHTVSIDLTYSEEAIDRQMRRGHRRDLRKAATMDYAASFDPEWSEFEAFYGIYQSLMRRLNARVFYQFSRQFFDGLRQRMRDVVHLFVVRQHGIVVGASLYTECQGVVTPFLGGTAQEHVLHSPDKLIDRFACSWAKARGNRVFHLGGGVGGKEDSLFDFKAGFSPRRHPYYTWHVTADLATYDALLQRRGPSASHPNQDGYFPAYRRPQ